MHSAVHVYNIVEEAGLIAGSEVAKRLPMFARSTVYWKLRLLVRAGVLNQDGATAASANFTISAPLDMEKIRKMVRDLNTKNKGSGRGEGKKLAEESFLRKKLRDEQGITARVVEGAKGVKASRRKPQPVVVETATGRTADTHPAWPSPAPVQRVVDAVLDVPLRDVPALKQRLKEILG